MGVWGHPPRCHKPQLWDKTPLLTGQGLGRPWAGCVGKGLGSHPDSHLLLDPVAEVLLDELAAGGGAEGQAALQ